MSELIAICKSAFSFFKRKSEKEKIEFQNDRRGKYFFYSGLKELNKNPKSKYPIHSGDSTLELVFSAFNDRFNMFVPVSNYYLKSPNRQRVFKLEKKYQKKYIDFHSKYISKFCCAEQQQKYFEPKDFVSLLKDDYRIKYILGEIGCGKSTFISHLLFYAQKEIHNRKNISIFCVNCSFEGIRETFGKEASKFTLSHTEEFVYKILNSAFKKQLKTIDFSDLEGLKKAIDKHFLNYKVTIVLDNLDQLYDESIYLLLKTTQNSNDFNKIYEDKTYRHFVVVLFKVILDIVNHITQANFILCVRPETHNALQGLYEGATGASTLATTIKQQCIQLENLEIEEIIQNRFKLGGLDGQSKLLDLLAFAKIFGKAASGLKVNGNRHIMSSLRSLIKDIDIDKLFYPQWLIKIYIYLDGYVKYSQKDCGICNIFLVNIDYRKSIDQYNEKFLKSTKKDHCQTYWLKYFICKYFSKIEADKQLDSNILYRDIFGQYELEIFNFCLYSLSEVEHGRLLGCNFLRNEINTNGYALNKTQRLGYCFEKKIFFNFSYLVVIVDDQWLEIPTLENYKEYFDEIFKPYEYKTIFNNDKELWKEWLFLSIKKVFTFVKILELSFKYEKERIAEESRKAFEIDFEDVFKSLSNNVRDISKTLDIPKEDIDTKIEEAMQFNSKISNPLEKHFKKYAGKVERFT